jgi:hypothetical protein
MSRAPLTTRGGKAGCATRWRVAQLASAVACLLVVAPAWGGAGRDPRELVLARSDLPAGTAVVPRQSGGPPALRWISASVKPSFAASRHYQAAFRLPGKDVYSAAFVFDSPAAAGSAFARLSRSLPGVYRRLKLPRLGDGQLTAYVVADGLEHRFVVRRRNVVWQLDVVDWNAASRVRSKVAALALARAQQIRVG